VQVLNSTIFVNDNYQNYTSEQYSTNDRGVLDWTILFLVFEEAG
jgi:hypothetical protein